MTTNKNRYLILDITNLLYRTFYAHKQEDDITIAGLAQHTGLVMLNKLFREYPCKKMIMCFDRKSWRKDYTASKQCVSQKPYKGNRRQKMTPKEKEKYQQFLDHLDSFETLIRDHTAIVALAEDGLEADDLVAGTVQVLSDPQISPLDDASDENELVIVSSDKDMIQLLEYPNVTLIDPNTGTKRTLKEWDNDPKWFMFEKCIRGDTSDNVMSARPHIKKQRLKRAYNDAYQLANLMNETWITPDGREVRVKDLFNENKLLMDLHCQPEEIQKKIIKTVLKGLNNPGEFSFFHFMRHLGKFELKKISEQAQTFVPMLSR